MKRKSLYVLSLVFIVLIGGVLMKVIQNDSLDIKTFNVNEYQYYIEKFPSEEKLNSFSDTEDLLKQVEDIWIQKYGIHIKKEKPYQISYDEKNGIWLVQGTLSSDLMGGVANILVDDTGEVLAIWHDK